MIIAATAFAQVDEVTLTTIGTGRTEDEATLRALRNALEQTFGTFVSANTSIVNDALVRDEIAATSKGNVKEYQKLSVIQLPNKTTSVTLKATISINKLISYARNNGSRAEFAGQTYAMNVKLLKLQQSNAEKTLKVMKENVIALCHGVFDYDITLGELKKEKLYKYNKKGDRDYTFVNEYILPLKLDIYATDVTSNIYSLMTETFYAISMSSSMIKDFDRNNLVHYGNLPVSERVVYDIYEEIINAIMKDFWRVKLRKINDTEYYAFEKFNANAFIFSSVSYGGHIEHPYSYMWLFSSRPATYVEGGGGNNVKSYNRSTGKPIAIVRYDPPTYKPRNAIDFWEGDKSSYNPSHWNYPEIPGLISTSTFRNFNGEFSKWNTNIDGQIYQQKLCSFDLCILLTDEELERFNGLELVGVTSPKHTSAPKPDKKRDAVKGYKKMSDLPLNSPIKIQRIRILTNDLPKKTYTIAITRKDPSTGQQTYKINIGAKKQECLYWEFNGDAIASAFANSLEGFRNEGYIDFQLYGDDCKITKFPKELSEFVYVQLKK